MALTAMHATCRTCETRFHVTPKRSFLGFHRLICPSCTKETLYPLTSGYRTIYWVIVMVMVLGIIGSYAEGSIAVPSLLGIGATVALVRDRRIRHEVAALPPVA